MNAQHFAATLVEVDPTAGAYFASGEEAGQDAHYLVVCADWAYGRKSTCVEYDGQGNAVWDGVVLLSLHDDTLTIRLQPGAGLHASRGVHATRDPSTGADPEELQELSVSFAIEPGLLRALADVLRDVAEGLCRFELN